jgi:hypothetical protein
MEALLGQREIGEFYITKVPVPDRNRVAVRPY